MEHIPKFEVGESIIIQKLVTESDTALNYGSGHLENLLATPSLVALMIEAASKLVDDRLPEGYITVGYSFTLRHDKPSVLGETVSIKAEIKSYDGNRIKYDVIAYDEIGIIGQGSHDRAVVNKKALLEKANDREKRHKNLDF